MVDQEKTPSHASNVPETSGSFDTHCTESFPYERSEVLKNMSTEISECEWGEFRSQYGPFKPTPAQIDAGFDIVQRKGWLDDSGAWVDNVLNPGGRTENAYFAVLVKISEALESVDMGDRTANFSFQQSSDRSPQSNLEGGSHKIDAYHFNKANQVERKSLKSESLLANQGTMGKFKLNDSETAAYDNRETLTSSALYAMDEDPQRMWIYGVTIEDRDLRLWYYSRSHSVVSKPQDWKANPREMISVFISFIFATTVELGYDPNVLRFIPFQRKKEAEYWIYRIPPEGEALPRNFWNPKPTTGQFFKTEMCVAQHRTHRITGRATRVWKVIRVKSFDDHNPLPGEKAKVLKDVWLDANVKTERQIQTELFGDIEQYIKDLPNEDQGTLEKYVPADVLNVLKIGQELYKRHFLTILSDTVGYETKERPTSAKLSPDILESPEVKVFRRNVRNESWNHATRMPPLPPTRPARQFTTKRQYRVVFDEICQALSSTDNFGSAMFALQGGIIGLICMHLAGWVHRDISSGNILLFKNGGNSRGILSDLEYAKKNSDPSLSADPKTGTPYFMAVSIQMRTSLPKIENDEPECPVPQVEQWEVPEDAPVPVKHNFIHDLESIWWLHLYTMVQYSASSLATTFSNDIFTVDGDATAKRLSVLERGVGHLYSVAELHHQSLKQVSGHSDKTRRQIYTAHNNFDEQTTTPSSDFAVGWVYELAKFSVENVEGQTIKRPASPIPEPEEH